ncbi:DUF1566 domain-containing protein [Candidatus Auribacterota bacterium]
MAVSNAQKQTVSCPIVDTGQERCYNNSREIAYPKPDEAFYGQDAQYVENLPAYQDNADGTVSDLNTGLMWSKTVDKTKVSLIEAKKIAKSMTLGGYTDWRVPNIKELYSLINFSGYTGFSQTGTNSSAPKNALPFINTTYFNFKYGDVNSGERYIDAQWLSSTKYVSTTMNREKTLFGVNFADGRIKGYGYEKNSKKGEKKFYARYVRGNAYGKNDFVDNGDGTISDRATGLMWLKNDNKKAMSWQEALKYAENLVYAGYNDWRLPNAKELQYIVDYSRSPDTTSSPAINSIFKTTAIINEDGKKDYPYFWTSTTHLDGPNPGKNAVYISFGRALGKMRSRIMDVHGAGAQRSDPKTGKPEWHGPQGDARRVDNYVRCVRGGMAKLKAKGPKVQEMTRMSSTQRPPRQQERGELKGGERKHGEMSSQNFSRHFIERLDKNGDNKISKSEFDGPRKHFSHLDRNNDGYIDPGETPKRPPLQGRRPKPGGF